MNMAVPLVEADVETHLIIKIFTTTSVPYLFSQSAATSEHSQQEEQG